MIKLKYMIQKLRDWVKKHDKFEINFHQNEQ